ncbi:MAG: hypothetical protein K2J17_00625 [Paramuribaculum sp.]|nr:hypothetical protein [Paramuribaculum sp.]MDE6782201.1 hypothetical protein [Paramuribaculum sp.]
MKKLLSIVALLALCVVTFSACSDDDEKAPQVTLHFTYGDAVKVVNTDLYVVKGDPFSIDAITCQAVRPNGVAIITGPVNYWLNDVPFGTAFQSPFGITIATESMPVGRYQLTIQMGLAEEGCALGTAVTALTFNVVEDVDQIPIPAGDDSQTQPVSYSLR